MSNIANITFITGNTPKAEQLSYHLGKKLNHQKIDLPEIQSLSLHEVVEQKVKSAYEIVKSPVLVDDTSLIFNALGKLPGPLIKWFLEELNTEGLCRLLNSYDERSAIATVMYGYYDGNILKFFSGSISGTISELPKGSYGFGWDSIFIPDGCDKTWGEMTLEEQSATSIRKIAIDELKVFLSSN